MTRHQRIDIGRFAASVVALMLLVVVVPIGLGVVTTERFGSAHPFAGVRSAVDVEHVGSRRHAGTPAERRLGDRGADTGELCVIWLAVIVMAATTVVETVHMVRHRGVAMPPVRGVGWAQGIARYIAVGLIVVMPLASAKPSLATTRTPASAPLPPVDRRAFEIAGRGDRASLAPAPVMRAPDDVPCRSPRTSFDGATRSSRSPPSWRVTTNGERW